MNRYTTEGIILARINYAEADRILTFLTPDHGKVRAFAKGVRKQKSKLAGGLELFSVSYLSLLVGKSEINTVISTKLKKHYSHIPASLDRTDAAYEMIKLLAKSTADHPEKAYFDLLEAGFESLNNTNLDPNLARLWFGLHLLKLTGHSPNLTTNPRNQKLHAGSRYNFDFDSMCLSPAPGGDYTVNHIKLLRLAQHQTSASKLALVKNASELASLPAGLIHLLTQRLLLHR